MTKEILMLCPFYPPNIGGAETFAEGLAKYLSKGNNVTVLSFVSFGGEGWDWERQGGLEIIRINWLFKMGKAWEGTGIRNFLAIVPKMLWFSIKLCRRKKFDIVLCNGLCAGFIGAILKVFFKMRVGCILLALYGFTGELNPLSDISGLILRKMDKVFVEGDNGAKDIEPLGISESKVVRFQHWVDQDIFKPVVGYCKDRITVLFIGRPIYDKGIHLVKWVESEMKDEVDFEYIENVQHEDLAKHYQMADVLVVPSLYPEGFVRVVAEGASCGCCVVVSQFGSLPEMVKSFGIEFDATDYRNLEFLIRVLDKNRIMLLNHQQMALEYAKNNFTEKNAEVFLSIC